MPPQLLSGAARLAGSSLLRLQSDERLVALVRDGHDPAFTAVVDRYRPELLRYATRLVGATRAEDVVQQALINAHAAMTSKDSDIRLRPWLYRIVHNASLNALRAGRHESELDERLAAAASVENDVETRERLREALAAIALLPEPQRDALVLHAVEGRSHDEIAAALGVSAGAARQHVHRARGMVRATVSAITPYGLLVRFAMAGGAEPASNAALAGAGAAGISATVAKVGVGVLAAGAIATGTTGHVPLLDGSSHKDKAKPAVRHEARATEAAATAVAVTSPAAASATSSGKASGSDGRHRSGRGTSEDNGPHGHGNSGSSGASGSSDGRGGSGESEPGDDRGRSGETERGDDRGGSGQNGRGDDSTSSGSSGGQRHGSDDGERSGSGSSQGSGEDQLSDRSGSGSSSGESSGSGTSGSGDSGTSGDGSSGSDDGLLSSPSDGRSGSGGGDDLLSGGDSGDSGSRGSGSGGDDD